MHPCLDTFNILVETNFLALNFSRLIRIYSTSNNQLPLRKFKYIKEYKLPSTNLLKIDCHLLPNAYKYYCFVFVAVNPSNNAIAFRSDPKCRATEVDTLTEEEINKENSADKGLIAHLKPAGSSLNTRGMAHLEGADGKFATNQIIDEINCECNNLTFMNFTKSTTVILEISACNLPEKREKLWFGSVELNETETYLDPLSLIMSDRYVCVLKLPRRHLIAELINVPTSIIRSVVVRDGLHSIDPQLTVSNRSIKHELKSSYLRLETLANVKLVLKFTSSKHNEAKESIHWFYSLTEVHYTLLALILFTVCSLLSLIFMALTTRKRKPKVQIMLNEEGPYTSESYLGNSTVSQFSFAEDVNSLEMDYYDYIHPFVPRSDELEHIPDIEDL